jgi:uroporphyrinogen-III synthase/uroporphyrinogen III methyltransferase/synthase
MSQDSDLSGCRVVVTRPEEQASELAEPLRTLGAQVRVRPLVGIAPPADPSALRAALDSLVSFQWVAFTSANAVRACAATAAPGAQWPRVACVGAGTARAAAAAGIPVSLVPTAFSGAALARALVREQSLAGVRVLWPRASGAREAFAALLREAGAELTEVECYRTLPDPGAAAALAAELRAGPADVVLFTSPSAIRAWQAGAEQPPAAAVAVIGGVTGDAATRAGWQVAVRPVEQSIAGLVAAVRQWWAERQS